MKKFLFILLVLCSGSFLFSQASVNPDDDFYKQLDRWEALGLVPLQPDLRPYPVQVIQNILVTVAKSDNKQEAQLAIDFYEELFFRKIMVKAEPEIKVKISTEVDKSGGKTEEKLTQLSLEPALTGDIAFLDCLSLGYNLAVLAGTNLKQNLLPRYNNVPYYLQDMPTKKQFGGSLESDASFAFVKGKFYVQAGINHNSYGPFYGDNVLFSSSAKHTANFAAVYNSDFIQFTDSLFVLSAVKESGVATRPDGTSLLFPEKFLALQSLKINLFPWLSGGFLNGCIYGKRFDPAYFIPIPFIVTEGVTGYDNDNIFMGASLVARPVKGLIWKNLFYLDDIGFTGFKEYHDIKLRCSFQTGVEYVPENISWLKKIDANYTMVTPYMYSHVASFDNPKLDDVNYQVYTTAGQAIATALQPNSDRISITADFNPIKNLNIKLNGTFIRHANVTEGLTVQEQLKYLKYEYLVNDGSINNHSLYHHKNSDRIDTIPSAWNKIMFLTQQTKEYTVRAGFDIDYAFPRSKWGRFVVGAGYNFEYVHNNGVGKDIFTRDICNNSAATEADVQAAIENWRNNLTDLFSSYFTLYVKYVF